MGHWGEKQRNVHGYHMHLAFWGTNSVASTVVGADFAPLRHHRQHQVVE
jgi:hypothetical protein